MNNIYSYDDYLNEGLFRSKYHNIVDKIYDYILSTNLNNITQSNNTYTLIFKSKQEREDDPLGEEVWDDDVKIDIKCDSDFDSIMDSYYLYVNEEKVPVKRLEAKKLFKIIDKRFNNRDEEERQKRINAAISKIK